MMLRMLNSRINLRNSEIGTRIQARAMIIFSSNFNSVTERMVTNIPDLDIAQLERCKPDCKIDGVVLKVPADTKSQEKWK